MLLIAQNQLNDLMYWKDIVNISFWIVNIVFLFITATVGIRTYQNAKKTLFQPIKTEIFKEQLKEFSVVLSVFNERGVEGFKEGFGLREMETLSRGLLLEEYFNVILQIEKKDLIFYKRESHEKFFEIAEAEESLHEKALNYLEASSGIEKFKNSSLGALDWNNGRVKKIPIPSKLSQKQQSLLNLNTSPLLPRKCKDLIGEFSVQLEKHYKLSAKIRNENLRDLLKRPHSTNSFKNLISAKQQNDFDLSINQLYEKSLQIISYVQDYFGTEDMMPKKKKQSFLKND